MFDFDKMIEEAERALESMPGFSPEQRHWHVTVDNQAKTITYTPTEEYRRGEDRGRRKGALWECRHVR